MNIIAIIPARGGSKGIPRKNVRPLAGKPLIYYSITAALLAESVSRVVVTTDDEEIALFAGRFGADVIMRPSKLAQDIITLDPVIQHAFEKVEEQWAVTYDIILTIQPTSPLVRAVDIDKAMQEFIDSRIDSVISVVEDRHLCWTMKGNRAVPTYEQRVNRQQLPPSFKETGAIIACRRAQLERGTRIGKHIALYEMPYERSFDIDTLADLFLCEGILNHKRIVITVVGQKEVGLGHAYRAVLLANELVKFDILFVCEEKDNYAREYIVSHNYRIYVAGNGSLLNTVISLNPDLVINDILDTDISYISELQNNNIKVVNFEDLGTGYSKADLVFNALYQQPLPSDHVFTGAEYFCLRDEFLYVPAVECKKRHVSNILVTFGGIDEGGLTTRVLLILIPLCFEKQIEINIVTGPGYVHHSALESIVKQCGNSSVRHISKTARISEFMLQADFAITSGGRTVFELAAMQVPTLVICQNKRETTHTFASSKNGIINLGYHKQVKDEEIMNICEQLLLDQKLRKEMRSCMKKMNLTRGKKRVIEKICKLMERDG